MSKKKKKKHNGREILITGQNKALGGRVGLLFCSTFAQKQKN